MVLLQMPPRHSFCVHTTPLATNLPQIHVKCRSLVIGSQEKRKQTPTKYKQTRIKCKQTRKSQKIFPPCCSELFSRVRVPHFCSERDTGKSPDLQQLLTQRFFRHESSRCLTQKLFHSLGVLSSRWPYCFSSKDWRFVIVCSVI